MQYPVTHFVYRPASTRLARVLTGTAITPLQVSFVSAALAIAAAGTVAADRLRLAGVLLFASIIADCADGDLARFTGRTSRLGAFVDSVLDRWTDAAVIVAAGLSQPQALGPVALVALAGSFLTPYTRARAQSLGIDTPDGVGGRDARILVLVIALLTRLLWWGLLVVALLGCVTAIHRAVLAARRLRIEESADEGGH